jgi:4-hydroxybenzoate polyprenyltransferase
MHHTFKAAFLIFRCARIILWPAIILNTGIVSLFGLGVSCANSILLALSLCCVSAYGFLINDYHDIPVDRINKANRLENANEGEVRLVLLAAFFFLGMSLILGLAFGWRGIGSSGLIDLGLAVYTFYGRKKLLFSTILCSILSSTPLWIPMLVFDSHVTLFQLGVILVAFLILMGRETIFDAADIDGDFSCERRTFATVYSQQLALSVGSVLNVAGVVVLLCIASLHQLESFKPATTVVAFLFTWLLLLPALRIKSDVNLSKRLGKYTQQSRFAMLLFPVLWLGI